MFLSRAEDIRFLLWVKTDGKEINLSTTMRCNTVVKWMENIRKKSALLEPEKFLENNLKN